MFSKSSSRFLSLMLALVMLVSLCPTAFAAEVGTEPPVITETTELPAAEPTPTPTPTPTPEVPAPAPEPSRAPEVTPAPEPSQAPEVTPSPEPSQAPEVTPSPEPSQEPEVSPSPDPAEETEEPENPDAEETEETDPDAEEAEEEDEEAEEEETIELPYGFVGMPEGYELSQAELAAKAALSTYDTVNTLAALTPGVDYAANEVIFTCEDAEYAQLVAEAYGAVLLDCSYGVAKLQLLTATVLEAVTAAADMTLPLPAVEPNGIIRINPLPGGSGALVGGIGAMAIGERQSWDSWMLWIRENLTAPDPYIRSPHGEYYQWMHDTVNSYEAWGVTTGSRDVVVAVLDTGVDAGHPDLAGKVIDSIDAGYGTGIPGGDHGTHVAGIIAATLGNGEGGAGIAPGVSILSIPVLGEGGFGTWEIISKGIRIAADRPDRPVDIINMSLGGPGYSAVVESAVRHAIDRGVTVVVAMGNNGSNTYCTPASIPGVIAVMATDQNGNRASYSNYGPWATVSAPGSDIISTVPGGGYESYNGTSMACPVVAGVAALYMSAMGHVDPQTMANVLKASAAKNGGVVNAAAMFDKVVNAPTAMVNGSTLSSSSTVSYVKSIALETQKISDKGETIIYTLDGKTPSVKNGQVVNGTVYTGPISLENFVGKTITLKAATVTGMGKISKVVSYKITVSGKLPEDQVSIKLTAPEYLTAGKSVQLTAELSPADKVSQKVTWQIIGVSGNLYGVKLSASGLLTAPKNSSGTVTVRATSVDYSNKYAQAVIQVETLEPVAKINLSTAKLSLYEGYMDSVYVASVEGAKGAYVDKNKVDFQWTSSNKKVATVDEYGNIQALAKGSATITCKALDGSNKTAKVSVTVLKPVESVTITGQTGIAPGAKASYKATVLPKDASNKKVGWELVGAPHGVTISSSGVVSVPAYVSPGVSFYVRANSMDGFEWCTYPIEVQTKCTGVTLEASSSYGQNTRIYNSYPGSLPRLVYNNYNILSAANLYTVVPYVWAEEYHTTLDLNAKAIGNGGCTFTWKSSNPKVATVDENGVITAVAKGSTTITCTAMDGSNKKASIKVNVLVPVSTMALKSSIPTAASMSIEDDPLKLYDVYTLGFGKSAKHTVVFGDTFGVPSNKKVAWDFVLKSGDTDLTYTARANKLVTLNNGTLSTKPALSAYANSSENMILQVTATALDGTGTTATIFYYLWYPATVHRVYSNYYSKVYVPAGGVEYIYLGSNQGYSAFSCSSNKPYVAGVLDATIDSGYHCIEVAAFSPGTAKITVKTKDGTNKSLSFTVVVY